MCPARAVPYGPGNDGTRRLSLPQRVHATGKAAPRWPALLHNIFALNWFRKILFPLDGPVLMCKISLSFHFESGTENMLSDTDVVCVAIY